MEDARGPVHGVVEVHRAEVALDHAEARLGERAGEVRLLHPPRVVVREAVDADHLVAAREQGVDEVRSDEAGAAGDHEAGHRANATRAAGRVDHGRSAGWTAPRYAPMCGSGESSIRTVVPIRPELIETASVSWRVIQRPRPRWP